MFDKAKIADHGALYLFTVCVIVFAVFAALSAKNVIPAIGHAVLVPFDKLLSDRGLHVIQTTNEVAGAGGAQGDLHPSPQPSPRDGRGGSSVVSSSYASSQTFSPTSSYADLAVRILVGAPDIVQFTIVNRGGTTAPGGWVFAATLPSSARYTSPRQPALAPGQGFTYTMEITNPSQTYATYPQYQQQQPPCNVIPATQIYYGTPYPFQQSNTCTSQIQNAGAPIYQPQPAQTHGTFSVIADPQGITGDSNRGNNVASMRI